MFNGGLYKRIIIVLVFGADGINEHSRGINTINIALFVGIKFYLRYDKGINKIGVMI
jgi:hypothetical protein